MSLLLIANDVSIHEVLEQLLLSLQDLTGPLLSAARILGGAALLIEVGRVGCSALMSPERGLDLTSLVHPLMLLLLVVLFPTLVLGSMNGLLKPVVSITTTMVESESLDMEALIEKRNELEHEQMMKDPETAYLVDSETFDEEIEALGWSPSDLSTMAGMYLERSLYQTKKSIREGFVEILELLFKGASLTVDLLRTFFLAVLSVLGPISLGLSIFPFFRDTFPAWLARYVQVYMYLPIANIFSAILSRLESLILTQDINSIADGGGTVWDSTSTVYILFLLMGILGYLFIPTIATWVVQGTGVQDVIHSASSTLMLAAGAVAGMMHHGGLSNSAGGADQTSRESPQNDSSGG